MAHVVVVGGGIAGLAAAYRLGERAPVGTRVTLVEASAQVGGKLRSSPVAGVDVDEGAEAMLVRAPEGLALARAVGLGGELVHPGTTRAMLWTRGELRPLPAGTVMGVPADLGALEQARVLSAAGLARVPLDLLLPRTAVGDDVPVGRYVAARMGREVVERLVDPLLGGVYAGRADQLSLAATLPQLATPARLHRSLLVAARTARAGTVTSAAPVFATVVGGLGRLARVVAEVATAGIRTRTIVRALERRPGGGWTLTVGSTRDEQRVDADAVILAVPAAAASRLLGRLAPAGAHELAGIEYASVAVVTLAFRRASLPPLPAGSGYLVPAVDGHLTKAVTFVQRKWPHVGAGTGLEIVRCSVGRAGDSSDLQRDDTDLVSTCSAELAAALGGGGELVASRVTRWGGALPQYAVGHGARVGRIRAAVEEHAGLALAGAAYDGVGIPACIRTAEAAVDRVLPALRA